MKDRLKFTFLVLLAMAVGLSSCKENPPPQPKAEIKKEAAEPEPAVVGRLTFMEKNVFRYLRDAKDWALAMVDVPVGDGDIHRGHRNRGSGDKKNSDATNPYVQ